MHKGCAFFITGNGQSIPFGSQLHLFELFDFFDISVILSKEYFQSIVVGKVDFSDGNALDFLWVQITLNLLLVTMVYSLPLIICDGCYHLISMIAIVLYAVIASESRCLRS